jgi:hypothetical protein
VKRPARFRSALGVALAGVALSVTPASALAKGGFDLAFHFPASNGYTISAGGYDATAFINASKSDRSHGRTEWSTYIARGKVSPTAIHASFGALGSAEMHFRQSGNATYGRRHQGCVGPDRYTIQTGVFVGTIHFRGEGGYVSATVHRVKGKVVTPRLLTCRDTFLEQAKAGDQEKTAKKHGKATRFDAYLRSGLTAMVFNVAERDGKAGFLAEIEQSVGSLGIFRGVSVRASPATFAFDSALSFAGVTPPAPFSGSASFQRAPTGRKSWTGSLAVSFPGAPDVSLTDPRLQTQLTRGW